LNAFGAAYHFIVWGLIWLVGFAITHFADRLPAAVGAWHWLVLNLVGNAFSLSFGYRMRKAFKTLPHDGIGTIWILFLAFGALGAFFVRPAGDREGTMLIIIITMLWMSVMGALVNRALLWMAVGVTALSAVSDWLFADVFYLVLALGGGGALIATGIYLLKRRGT
jgi:hypothetical protein